jgi:SOS-response transcriptional repressor LexA
MSGNWKDQYAVRVPDDVMEPQAYKGQMATVDPNKPPTCGCLVVAAIDNDGKNYSWFIRQYRGEKGDGVVLRSLHPKPADQTIKREGIKHVHRIVMLGDPL